MKTTFKIYLYPVFLLIAFSGQAAIFGADTRIQISKNSAEYKIGQAVALGLLNSSYEKNADGSINLTTSSLSDFMCRSEKFQADTSMSFACTGFLISSQHILTAGHCTNFKDGEIKDESEGYCEAYDWMFDYISEEDGSIKTKNLSANNLYHCKKIVYSVLRDSDPYSDFAIIELDRPVIDREPLKISKNPIAVGDEVKMAGHPLGTPMKWSYDAKVILNNLKHDAFVTNLDAFEGNSGSPVLNQDNEVIGILVSGTPSESFVKDVRRGCEVYNHCDEAGENCLLPDTDPTVIPSFQKIGSDVQRIPDLRKFGISI